MDVQSWQLFGHQYCLSHGHTKSRATSTMTMMKGSPISLLPPLFAFSAATYNKNSTMLSALHACRYRRLSPRWSGSAWATYLMTRPWAVKPFWLNRINSLLLLNTKPIWLSLEHSQNSIRDCDDKARDGQVQRNGKAREGMSLTLLTSQNNVVATAAVWEVNLMLT